MLSEGALLRIILAFFPWKCHHKMYDHDISCVNTSDFGVIENLIEIIWLLTHLVEEGSDVMTKPPTWRLQWPKIDSLLFFHKKTRKWYYYLTLP